MRRISADVLVVAVAVVLAGADVHYHRHDLPLVTATLRRPFVLICLTALTLHAWNVLGRFDPFRFAACRIPRCA